MSLTRLTFSTVSSLSLGIVRKHLGLPLGLVLAIGLTQPAFAGVFVDVIVLGFGNSYSTDTEGQFPGAKIVSGSAHIDGDSGFANVQAGPFSECPLCLTTGPGTGSAFVRAEANGVAGALRALAQSGALAGFGPNQGGAFARLTDNITFLGTPVVNFDIDLSSTLSGEGFSGLFFQFGLRGRGLCGEGPCSDNVLARLIVDATRFAPHSGGGSQDRRFHELMIDNTVVQAGEFIPNNFQFSYDFGPFLIPPPFPGFPAVDNVDFFAELTVDTYSSGENLDSSPLDFNSFARMASDQSVYIQIDNVISANGYSYPGRPGPQIEVPAPASLALLAIGLAGLVVTRRRKR